MFWKLGNIMQLCISWLTFCAYKRLALKINWQEYRFLQRSFLIGNFLKLFLGLENNQNKLAKPLCLLYKCSRTMLIITVLFLVKLLHLWFLFMSWILVRTCGTFSGIGRSSSIVLTHISSDTRMLYASFLLSVQLSIWKCVSVFAS